MCLSCDGTVFALKWPDGQLHLKMRDPEALYGEATAQLHNMPSGAAPAAALDDPCIAADLACRTIALL